MPEEAIDLLERRQATEADRERELLRAGYPAYTRSVGWMGHSDDLVRRLCREAVGQGFQHFKMKVGGTLEEDRHRVALVWESIGQRHKLMMDANQR